MGQGRARSHLFVALNTKGLGEVLLGVRVALDLKKGGHQASFVTLKGNERILRGLVPYSTFKSASAPLLPFMLKRAVRATKAASVILSDYLTCSIYLRNYGVNKDALAGLDVPVLAIDTWRSNPNGDKIDCFGREAEDVPPWPEWMKPIRPVPILHPNTSAAYDALPEKPEMSKRARKHLRHALGIGRDEKAILFCTARWQHPSEWRHHEGAAGAGKRLAGSLPMLVAQYVAALGESVHFVHVGPEPYELNGQLDDRYHWLPPMSAGEFDRLVASMDLLLSANISATTVAKAMVSNVPVLVLQNSVSGDTLDEVEGSAGRRLSTRLCRWVEASLPLFPFALWPVGYHRFLAPVLRDNPYTRAVDTVEVLDEDEVESTLAALMWDNEARDDQLARHASYLDVVRSFPSPAQLVTQLS